jgi:ABC-type lipoprotein release transport system permease subunit
MKKAKKENLCRKKAKTVLSFCLFLFFLVFACSVAMGILGFLKGGLVMNNLNKDVEEKVLERFYSGETNISKLAKEMGINRRTVCRIVKSDPERYEQAIRRARNEAAERRKQQQRQASKKCKQKKRAEQRGYKL